MHKLIVLLLILLSTTVRSDETTSNLLNQNFDSNGWSGTADGRHGSTVVASEHNTYIKSESISLLDNANLTQGQINNGFTTNHSFKYWHWNTYESNVKSTQTIIGADGETTTQIRNYNSTSCGYTNCGGWASGSDSVVVQSNIQTDYNVSIRYDFTDTSNNANAHYGVDLKEPSLTITYDPIVLDNNTITLLNEVFEELEEEIQFEEIIFQEEIVFEEFNEPEIITEEFNMAMIEEEVLEEPTLESFQEEVMITEEVQEEQASMEEAFVMEFLPEPEQEQEEVVSEEMVMEEETLEEEPTTETADKPQTKTQDSTEQVSSKSSTSTDEKKSDINVSLVKTMDKIDEKIKDIDKNLKVKNIVKINAMVDNSMLLSYQIEFYKDKKIYENQLDIRDDRLLYTANLGEYQQSDPIFIKQNQINNIRLEKEKLLKEIEVLKNG
tara:strand:+ start:650 stop:1966 length:1317 start_codon:yes stop_codon:yes gene_type:complete